MAKNPETMEMQGETTAEFESLPLLPRSAWHSQLTFLKVLLKAKQALDKNERQVFKKQNIKGH